MNTKPEIKTNLDSLKIAIATLAIFAVILLGAGIYFLLRVYKPT